MSNETQRKDQKFIRTTSVNDFILQNLQKPPQNYPKDRIEDVYSKEPFELDYNRRKDAYKKFCLKNPANSNIKGLFYEILRISESQEPVWYSLMESSIKYVNSRQDCSDFILLGLMRMYIQFAEAKLMNKEFLKKIEDTILSFKYWPTEHGIDSMCYWTENHQILFSVNEYLAGQLFPDRIFSNSGMKGSEKKHKAKKQILQWLELRFYSGFNEWLSNVYYDEDIPALLNIIDFCQEEDIVQKAKIILDLLFFDMAVNSYYGQFVSTHGRTYTAEKKSALCESTTDTMKLVFGMGIFANRDNMSAISLVLSKNYIVPEVIIQIAWDFNQKEMINQQRIGIKIKEAKKWGLCFNNIQDGMTLLSFEAYVHPKTINTMIKMLDQFGWWENRFFLEFKPFKKALQIGSKIGIAKLTANILKKDLTRNTREENNIYTYRTPDYLLSNSQDYKKGYGGDQHHIWQATLGPEAICFTTHPGGYTDASPEGYWLGSGYLPKVVQIKNVLIAIYKIPKNSGILLQKNLNFTHAWFPKSKFNEVVEKQDWIFGRYQNGYIALRSQNEYYWQENGNEKNKEIIVNGRKNIWIVELGRKEISGSFENFINGICNSKIEYKNYGITYESPTQGLLKVGWKKAFVQNSVRLIIDKYPKYKNPYCTAEFRADNIKIIHAGSEIHLNFLKSIRYSHKL